MAIINVGTEPATFTLKPVTIQIDKNNISKFFTYTDTNADAVFSSDTYKGTPALSSSTNSGTVTLVSKYNFSNVSFKYSYTHCSGSNSKLVYTPPVGSNVTHSSTLKDDKSLSYDEVSSGKTFAFKYTYCSCGNTSKTILYDIKVKVSLFDILASKPDINYLADLSQILSSNSEKLAFSNLDSLRVIDFGT